MKPKKTDPKKLLDSIHLAGMGDGEKSKIDRLTEKPLKKQS